MMKTAIATFGRPFSILCLSWMVIGCEGTDTSPSYIPDTLAEDNQNFELVWEENFDQSSLSNQWNIETGYGVNGWGNNESQRYTASSDNLTLSNGQLVITAKCDLTVSGQCGVRDNSITSARINTKDKIEFRYGKLEARIKIPSGQSTWPAFWALGANFPETTWPHSGEIDVMEVWQSSSDLKTSHSTVHYFDQGHRFTSGQLTTDTPLSEEFQVWSIIWDPNSIKFSLNGVLYHTVLINSESMNAFQQPFFLILNIAINGTLGGDPDQILTTPQKMIVDYIKLYQNSNLSTNQLSIQDG